MVVKFVQPLTSIYHYSISNEDVYIVLGIGPICSLGSPNSYTKATKLNHKLKIGLRPGVTSMTLTIMVTVWVHTTPLPTTMPSHGGRHALSSDVVVEC
ncbi:hypothetical protein SLA2020_276960 [Shorea laevis]